MKPKLIIPLAAAAALSVSAMAYSQTITYAYDESGNRIRREIVMSQKNIPSHAGVGDIPVEERLPGREIRIYPDPTKGMLRVEVSGWVPGDNGRLFLYSLSGQTIVSIDIDSPATILDISTVHNGVYVLQISLNGRSSSWKIIRE